MECIFVLAINYHTLTSYNKTYLPRFSLATNPKYYSEPKCDVLRDLVPFVQFKKRENTHGRVLILVKLQASTLLKLTLLQGCFSCFLNCTNDTKLRNAPQMRKRNITYINIFYSFIMSDTFFRYGAYKWIEITYYHPRHKDTKNVAIVK